jgi:DNA uptake protein ComE-like DNA-binding protein
MAVNRLAVYALILTFTSAPALAQDNKRVPSPMIPAPAASSSKPSTGAAPTSVSTKINLNTATQAELGTLPRVSPAQSKAIIGARGKAKFKSWDDFVARKVVSSQTAEAIKNSVSF